MDMDCHECQLGESRDEVIAHTDAESKLKLQGLVWCLNKSNFLVHSGKFKVSISLQHEHLYLSIQTPLPDSLAECLTS